MSAQPTALLVLTGTFGTKLNAVNTGVGVKNADGSINVRGTVIGIAQSMHSIVDFATIGSNVGKWLPGTGALIGAFAIFDSAQRIIKSVKDGTPIQQSDIAGLIGSAAGLAGAGALLVTSSGLIVPVTVVVGLGAGAYQLIASVGGWTIGADGRAISRPPTLAESQEIQSTLAQAQQSGLIPQPAFDAAIPTGFGTPARNSSNYFTASGAHSMVAESGGTLSDLWLVQKNAANGFASEREFYAAILASNPALTDIDSIQAGQAIYLPQKLADGSITYFTANGASVNHNAASGEYHMVIPNGDGGQTIYQRSGDGAAGYTLRQTSTNALGLVTFDFTGRQATPEGVVIETGLTTIDRDGKVTTTRTDTSGDGVFDTVRTETRLGTGASLIQEDANADGLAERDWLVDAGQRYDLHDTSQALFADSLISRYYNQGGIDYGQYQSLNQIVADTLVSLHDGGAPWGAPYGDPYGGFGGWNLDPIGAFYEAASPALDPAASIAARTPVLLDNMVFRDASSSSGDQARAVAAGLAATTAAALQARDANRDGKLTGAELNGLQAWIDGNEDGIRDAGETQSLAQAGIAEIRAADYALVTRGNARPGAEPLVLSPWRPGELNGLPMRRDWLWGVPASSYRLLRDTDNTYWIDAYQSINFAPTQVKVNNANRSYLIGTDGNDRFDANYYAAYPQWINSNLLVNFLAGGGDDVMGGSARDDRLWGGTGNDALLGYAGDDKLYGEEGNDELQGGAGNDTLDGGSGNDALFGQAGNDTLVGGEGDDILNGFTASNEAQQALSAGETDNDSLYGGAGRDQMYGGPGEDYLDGGSGDDSAFGGQGNDSLFGGDGADVLQGDAGNDKLLGEAGDDRLFGGVGNDMLWGGNGNDILMGFTPGNDPRQTLAPGESDDDILFGGAGDDELYGGPGADTLDGGDGNDLMLGGDGADQLYGGAGADELSGGANADTLLATAATTSCSGAWATTACLAATGTIS